MLICHLLISWWMFSAASLPLCFFLFNDYKPYTYWLLTAKPTNHRPTCSSQASSMRAHSHSTGASGPRRKRRASSASRLLPCDSRNRGVSGMKHMQTISRVGGMEAQIASQRQSTKRPARWVHTAQQKLEPDSMLHFCWKLTCMLMFCQSTNWLYMKLLIYCY